MKNPILSIITPVYNCEKYIEFSLNSIFKQSFQYFELIVINDGSTDNTWDIVKNVCEPHRQKIILIDNKDNKGVFIRRDQAIEACGGKYIALNDGDDYSFYNRLEKQIVFLEENSRIFCVGSHAQKIDQYNKYYYENKNDNGLMDYPPEKNEEVIELITKKCMNPIIDPTTMFRKDDYLELGGYSLNKDIKLVGDFDFWLKSISAGKKFYNIQKPLIYYRVNPDSNTRKYKKKMITQHMIVWREFMKGKRR